MVRSSDANRSISIPLPRLNEWSREFFTLPSARNEVDAMTHTHKLRGSCSIETFWWAAAHRLNASCNVTRAYAAEVLVHFRFLRSTLRLILMHSTNTQANLLKATCTTQQPNTQRLRYIDNICRYKVLQSNQNELCLPFTVSTLCHRYSCKRQQML